MTILLIRYSDDELINVFLIFKNDSTEFLTVHGDNQSTRTMMHTAIYWFCCYQSHKLGIYLIPSHPSRRQVILIRSSGWVTLKKQLEPVLETSDMSMSSSAACKSLDFDVSFSPLFLILFCWLPFKTRTLSWSWSATFKTFQSNWV